MKAPRILMILAAGCLLLLFVWPIWSITLTAPQYPDGVTMYIHINKIAGETPGTLQNVNILNHYIGMKPIEPESIKELTYFPYVIIVVALLGFLMAYVDKPWGYLSWGILMVVLAALGIYDFYLWEYDYGHNLDPKAPIKIAGASFQPPLIGSKMIINFKAESYPHWGGVAAGIGVMLSFVAWWFSRKGRVS